jgi:hypothetical protein
MADLHQFNHAAMATHFQVRIAHDESTYAARLIFWIRSNRV